MLPYLARQAIIAGYNAADAIVDRNDSTDEHYKDIVRAGYGMCDPSLARILADEAPQTIPELESMGVKFEKDKEKYLEIQGCFSTRPRTHIIYGHSEPILSALKKEILKSEVRIFENTIISNLLIDNNRCVGAVGITKEGDILMFKHGEWVSCDKRELIFTDESCGFVPKLSDSSKLHILSSNGWVVPDKVFGKKKRGRKEKNETKN